MSGPRIRPSQFITTYGPGSIIEASNGPRLIKHFFDGVFKEKDLDISKYEITEPRLSKALQEKPEVQVKFARIPSNAELKLPETRGVYSTRRFPHWSICTAKHQHKVNSYIVYKYQFNSTHTCPECPPETTPKKAYNKAGREAIRFITACENGHMSDIDWKWQVCRTKDCSDYLYMSGSGALKNIKIYCPSCNSSRSLLSIYKTSEKCRGFNQENYGEQEDCDLKSKVVHRGAAYLRFPELSTSLKIEPNNKLDNDIDENPQLRTYAFMAYAADPENPAIKFNEFLSYPSPLLTNLAKNKVLGVEVSELNSSIVRLNEIQSRERTQESLKLEEFETLQKASVQGVPPRSEPPNYIPNLEVRASDVKEFKIPSIKENRNLQLRITPVNRLKTVIVQTGFRRLNPDEGKRISCHHEDQEGNLWYPAVELLGEGIFIDLSPNSEQINLTSSFANNWRISEDVDHPPPPLEKHLINPLFVWWHTLSHRLINSLSLNSGYGSASIRERIYLSNDKSEGGILLYTTQTGGDGTYGGLVSQVEKFDKILDHAFHTIDSCSNDPICGSSMPSPKILNGAACFSCSLISETSCEFRNFALDRNVLRLSYDQ